MQTRSLLWLPVLLLAVLIAFAGYSFNLNARDNANTILNKPFPAFSLSDESGDTMTEHDLLGKVSIWHVWASWCHVCAIEWDELADYSSAANWIGMAYHDANARSWLQAHGNPFARVVNDVNDSLAFDLGVVGAPETFLIDAKGIVRARWYGAISPQMWQARVLPKLQQLQREVANG
jgi:cytochrome c biogenesis protein CcmG, thiol:disulfide interchange protein DsbE